jgi:hypothetical protein
LNPSIHRKIARHWHRFIAVALVLCVFDCTRAPVASTPEGAVRLWAEAVRTSDFTGAYALLSKHTRQQLEKRSSEVADASGGLIDNAPQVMFFQSGIAGSAIEELKVMQQSPIAATVSVGQKEIPIQMVLEEGRWRVDLSTLLVE